MHGAAPDSLGYDKRVNRSILVTGGANGLGAAMVRHFAESGDRVTLADVDADAGEKLASEIGCLFVQTDVALFADNQNAVEAAVKRFGKLDAICLNAGVAGGATIGERFDAGKYRHGMQINLDGVVYGANVALPHLRVNGGAILITSSIAGIAPALDVYYSAAKHALIGFTRSLALHLREHSVTVNALCPGFIDTRIIARVRDALVSRGVAVASPVDVAAVAAEILESPETGQAWEVQAGKPATRVAFPQVDVMLG